MNKIFESPLDSKNVLIAEKIATRANLGSFGAGSPEDSRGTGGERHRGDNRRQVVTSPNAVTIDETLSRETEATVHIESREERQCSGIE